ncbi:hypothetical protein Tco_0232212, partial [Tanacetum coccineum]
LPAKYSPYLFDFMETCEDPMLMKLFELVCRAEDDLRVKSDKIRKPVDEIITTSCGISRLECAICSNPFYYLLITFPQRHFAGDRFPQRHVAGERVGMLLGKASNVVVFWVARLMAVEELLYQDDEIDLAYVAVVVEKKLVADSRVSFSVPRSSRSHVGTHFPATIIISSLAFCSSSLPLLLVTLFYLLSFSFLLLANRFLLVDSCLSTLACRLLLVFSFEKALLAIFLAIFLAILLHSFTLLLANFLLSNKPCCCDLVAFFSSPAVIKKLAACFRLSLPDYLRCNRPFLALHTSGMSLVALIPRVEFS